MSRDRRLPVRCGAATSKNHFLRSAELSTKSAHHCIILRALRQVLGMIVGGANPIPLRVGKHGTLWLGCFGVASRALCPRFAGVMKLLEVLLELRVVHLQKRLRVNPFGLEARVGIEQSREVFSKSTTPRLPPHHQRRTASQLTNANRIRHFRR